MPFSSAVLASPHPPPFPSSKWIARLSHELQSARKRAEIASLRTVGSRLEAWLIWNDGALPARGYWRDLANEIAVSPEALYREFSGRRTKSKLGRTKKSQAGGQIDRTNPWRAASNIHPTLIIVLLSQKIAKFRQGT